jgi:hypothetical protein
VAAGSVASEAAGGGHEAGVLLEVIHQEATERLRDGLAIEALEGRLMVVEIEMAGGSGHEEEDDASGFGSKVRGAWREGAGMEEVSEGHEAEAGGGTLEK